MGALSGSREPSPDGLGPSGPARILRLEEALATFVGIRDQFPQSAKLINRNVDDLSPIAVTVTKAQFREAVEALRDSRGYVE